MSVQQLRWSAEYTAFRLLACLIEMLSPRQTSRLAHNLAWFITTVLPKRMTRYHVAKENISQAFGSELSPTQIDRMIYEMWVHLFRLVAEIIQFPRKFDQLNYEEVIRIRNRDLCVSALLSGRSVFLVGGHFGNWEATTVTFGAFGFKLGAVARKLDNPYLDHWFKKSRESSGHKLLMKEGGWDGMNDILGAGGNLALMCDQDAGKRGVFVNFFGRPASTFRSIALMAIEQQALIVVGYGIRTPDDFENNRWVQFEIGCETVIDVKEIVADDEVLEISQRYSDALEAAIRRAPEQYFWVHRRWKTEPRKKREAPQKQVGESLS